MTDVASVSPQAWATRAPTSSCSVLGFSSLLEGSSRRGGFCMLLAGGGEGASHFLLSRCALWWRRGITLSWVLDTPFGPKGRVN